MAIYFASCVLIIRRGTLPNETQSGASLRAALRGAISDDMSVGLEMTSFDVTLVKLK